MFYVDYSYCIDSFVFHCVFITVYRIDWRIDRFSCTAQEF